MRVGPTHLSIEHAIGALVDVTDVRKTRGATLRPDNRKLRHRHRLGETAVSDDPPPRAHFQCDDWTL